MVIATIGGGVMSLSHFLSVIRAGGVGKNGSTVAVSQKTKNSKINSS